MTKYLWIVKPDKHGVPCKSKGIVVYENSEFIYCKVNGSNELLRVNRSKLDNFQYSNCLYTFDGDKANSKALNEFYKLDIIAKLQKSIRSLEQNKQYYESKIDEYNKTLREIENGTETQDETTDC